MKYHCVDVKRVPFLFFIGRKVELWRGHTCKTNNDQRKPAAGHGNERGGRKNERIENLGVDSNNWKQSCVRYSCTCIYAFLEFDLLCFFLITVALVVRLLFPRSSLTQSLAQAVIIIDFKNGKISEIMHLVYLFRELSHPDWLPRRGIQCEISDFWKRDFAWYCAVATTQKQLETMTF